MSAPLLRAQSPQPPKTTCLTEAKNGKSSIVYCDFQVDKPVKMRSDSRGPAYPDMLRMAGIEGMVLLQFVVDTTGRAEPSTIKVIKSDNDLFTMSVRAALDSMICEPAEINKRKVKQLVQQPFGFSLNK